MKVLAKTKKDMVLLLPGSMQFIDCYRYRVVENTTEIDRWEARELIEVHYVKDIATDEEFCSLFAEKGEKAVELFVQKYNPNSVDVVEKKEETKIEKENTEEVKEVKSYKQKGKK